MILKTCYRNLAMVSMLAGIALLTFCRVNAAEPLARHVVVISVDGLPAAYGNDPKVPIPTIRKLMAKGVTAEGVVVSNPSVTWPNHTSMMTGVRPERHGVLFNGKLERAGAGLPPRVDPKKDLEELVHAPTIFEAVRKQSLTCAAINWPCTRRASFIDDNFPDVPEAISHTTPRLLEDLVKSGVMTRDEIDGFDKSHVLERDRIWTDTVCHLIRTRAPHLTYLHILNLDSIHHRYGPQTPAGYTAAAFADRCVRDVVLAIQAAGIENSTTIFIVSDHGFMSIPKTLLPNVVLRQNELLELNGNKVESARAHSIPEGGIAMVYLTDPDRLEADRQKVIKLFAGRDEIAAVLTPEDFGKYGLPVPREYPQMADLVLVAKDGYGFAATATGEEFVVPSESTLGTHGFLSTNTKMNAIFVASGAGIVSAKKIGVIENIDLAPTVAKLLNVPLPSADGKVLTEAFLPDPK